MRSNVKRVIGAIEGAERKRLQASAIAINNHQRRKIREYNVIDTGRTFGSVTYEVSNGTVRCGTDVEYAIFPVVGARGREPRPWPQDGLDSAKNEIRAIWGEGLRI